MVNFNNIVSLMFLLIFIFAMFLVLLENEMKVLFSFLATVFSFFFLLVTANHEFFGIIILLVYAGVISVLVLFIVMSSKTTSTLFSNKKKNILVRALLYVSFVILLSIFIVSLLPKEALLITHFVVFPQTSPNFFVSLLPLYSAYLDIFLIIAAALLVALVGALVITEPTRKNIK